MTPSEKGKSPFYPGQPVPVELFAGRRPQIQHIMQRGVGQVAAGKPVAIYVEGEYGIGKSSIAGLAQWLAEREPGLHAIYAPLGAARSVDDIGAAVLEGTLRSGAFEPKRSEKVRGWLAKYVGEQPLFGAFTLHAESLRKDAPSVARGLLPFLSEARERLADTGIHGLFLVLDEINGISENPEFAHFIKGLVDENAMSARPLPLLLMLCGVEERRRAMIKHHQPVDRIFDVVSIEPMSKDEMSVFFKLAFSKVGMEVHPEALAVMTEYSSGLPKIMHLIGDAAYWLDQDGAISEDDAWSAVIRAADDVGRKYVAPQIYSALHSKDYHAILRKVAGRGIDMSFRRADILKGLTSVQQRKFDDFLHKMKRLNVLRSGNEQGEYVFNQRMVRVFIWLDGIRQERDRT